MYDHPSYRPEDLMFKINNRPMGVNITMSWLQICAILEFIDANNIMTFVEIGVSSGGLGSILVYRTLAVSGFCYLGIEINESAVDKGLKEDAFYYLMSNYIFGDAFAPETLKDVKRVLDIAHSPVMILSDGGNKPKELQIYSKLIDIGDFIMCHDYTPTGASDDGDDSGLAVRDHHLEFLVNDKDHWREVPNYRNYRIPVFQRIA